MHIKSNFKIKRSCLLIKKTIPCLTYIELLTVCEVLNLGVEDLKLEDMAGVQVCGLALYWPGAGPSFYK